jgi:hypothetical protein
MCSDRRCDLRGVAKAWRILQAFHAFGLMTFEPAEHRGLTLAHKGCDL